MEFLARHYEDAIESNTGNSSKIYVHLRILTVLDLKTI